MSKQLLLSKDCLVRAFSICFESSELPVIYQTDDGPIKTRSANELRNGPMSNYFSNYIRDVKEFIDGRKVDMTKFDCNYTVWKSISMLFSDSVLEDNYYLNSVLSHDMCAVSDTVSYRLGHWVPSADNFKLREQYGPQEVIFHRFMSLAEYIEEARDTYNRSVRFSIAKWVKEGSFGALDVQDPFGKKKPIKIYQVGGVVLLIITPKSQSPRSFVMTNTHLSRIIEYLKSTAVLSIYAPAINGLDCKQKSICKLIRSQIRIGLKTPNGVGSVFKTARQLLFLKGDKSSIMGSSAEMLFSNGLSGVKEKYAHTVSDMLLETTGDRKSALNLSNIFRMVPHPDAEMSDVFDSIKGFTSANPVNDSVMPRYLGNVRKTMYQSLTAQRFDMRVRRAADHTGRVPRDEVMDAFVAKVNSTTTPLSAIMESGYVYWSGVEFIRPRGLFDEDNQDIPVSNKSSAPNIQITEEESETIREPKSLSDYKDVKARLKAVNDVVTKIDCRDDLDFARGRMRFRLLIKLHEEFEQTYLNEGIAIDDIPSDDLSDFLKRTPDARYIVLTEPKLGEVHKEITRLFYMAEQALKIMTQVAERIAKKVISKSVGISITKSNRGRRKEIEEMLDAYTGITFVEDDDGEMSVLFMSFDMSEFSKKFPQKLVRAIGKVLSELTGEDWLERVDVFFRASVVFHNTRGFLGERSGVTGGFEGFLNFIWTLAMKVVMDIATESTGVEGVLAVYSDDGLLRLYISGSKEEIRVKVMTIKRVFKNHGLIFHLDKTVVSAEILEYLGLYADCGMLIPTWIKEMMSIGKRKQSPGLETLSDKISLWDSQVNAVVKANGPHYPSLLVKNFFTISTLRRVDLRASSRILALLTIIPSSAGGFRTSSLSEMSLLSSIEGFSEFSADLELLSNYDPTSANAIANGVYENLKLEVDAEKSIPTGSFLQTTLPDTSGLGIATVLVEDAGISSGLAANPMTYKIRKKILDEVRASVNVKQRIIRELVSEVPDIVEYNKSIAIMKSSAALRFVDRKKIALAQSSDTRKCKRSIEWWKNEIESFSGRQGKVDAHTFCEMVKNKLYPSYRFAFFKQSPRVCIIPCVEEAMIITNMEFTSKDLISNQVYKEPTFKHLGAQLTPEITAETSFNTKKRMVERFVSTAAKLISTNVSLLGLYYIVANAFSLPCPSVPSNQVLSSHRSTRNFGSSAVTSILPAPYHSLVTSRMSARLFNELRGQERCDRTTYVEAARIATSLRSSVTDSTRRIMVVGTTCMLYDLVRVEVNTSNPVFESHCTPEDNLIKTSATKSFTDTIIEENAQRNAMEATISTNGLMETISDGPIVKGILLSKMTKWLLSSVNGNIGMTSMPDKIPDPWKKEIFVEAICSVAFGQCAPNVRRAIQLSLNGFLNRTLGMSTESSVEDPANMRLLGESFLNRAQAFEAFNMHFVNLANSLSCIDLDISYKNMLERLTVNDIYVRIKMLDFIKRRSVTGGITLPTTIINTNSFADTGMSREVKNSINTLVDSMMCHYIDSATTQRHEISERHTDATINFLNLMKSMLRPSGHRNTPFNKHMMAIQYLKYELFLKDCFRNNLRSVTAAQLTDYRTPGVVCREIRRQNAVIDGRVPSTSGEDMRLCLIEQGIPPSMVSRTNYLLRTFDDNGNRIYPGTDITVGYFLGNYNAMAEIIKHVLCEHNNMIKGSIDSFEIRHTREADLVTNMTRLSPVDEASLIMANTVSDTLVSMESNILRFTESPTYMSLLENLLLTHSMRWATRGYRGNYTLNQILRRLGILGETRMDVRDGSANAIVPETTVSDLSIHYSIYRDSETATHNYLFVNRLGGGMAVMARNEDNFLLLSIIPSGTRVLNTESNNVPDYIGDLPNNPVIYQVKTASNNLALIAQELGMRPRTFRTNDTLSAIVIRQAYQRLVGSTSTVENDDCFLCAMAEMARGSWSMQIGNRIYSMFLAWMESTGEVGARAFVENRNMVEEFISDGNPGNAAVIQCNANTVWEWLKLSNITSGPDIDTSLVQRMVRKASRGAGLGGSPAQLLNMIPVSVEEVKRHRSVPAFRPAFYPVVAILFRLPAPLILEDEYFDAEEENSDSDDDEW